MIDRILSGSKRTYSKPGQKLVDHLHADGRIRYRPNSDHPAFADFAESLPADLRRGFFNYFALVGASLPIETLYSDMAGSAEQIVQDRVVEDTLAQAVQATLSVLMGVRKELKEIIALMMDVDPFRSAVPCAERKDPELNWADLQGSGRGLSPDRGDP